MYALRIIYCLSAGIPNTPKGGEGCLAYRGSLSNDGWWGQLIIRWFNHNTGVPVLFDAPPTVNLRWCSRLLRPCDCLPFWRWGCASTI